MNQDEAMQWFLRWRGVRGEPCPQCKGAGRRSYSNGATWRGGVGTASIKWDVCDACWGSGSAEEKGADLRALEQDRDETIARRALEYINQSIGLNPDIKSLRPTYEAVIAAIEELGKPSRKRETAASFRIICNALARALRKGLGRE
jgi:hypothetical protein